MLYAGQGKHRNNRRLKPSPTVGANPWPLRRARNPHQSAFKAKADNQQKTLNQRNEEEWDSVPLFFLGDPVERRYTMADLNIEKIELRKQIISAANVYKNNLAGKVYLYVYGDTYFEVAYMTECFKHLTGVESSLRGNSFYDNAKNATLATSQISFSSRHPLKTAKKKIICLHQLPQLTKDSHHP